LLFLAVEESWPVPISCTLGPAGAKMEIAVDDHIIVGKGHSTMKSQLLI